MRRPEMNVTISVRWLQFMPPSCGSLPLKESPNELRCRTSLASHTFIAIYICLRVIIVPNFHRWLLVCPTSYSTDRASFSTRDRTQGPIMTAAWCARVRAEVCNLLTGARCWLIVPSMTSISEILSTAHRETTNRPFNTMGGITCVICQRFVGDYLSSIILACVYASGGDAFVNEAIIRSPVLRPTLHLSIS